MPSMLSMLIPTLVILCCLWRTTASTIVLGTESGRTTLFFEFTAIITTAATATAPDATITGAETVVLDSTHIHVVEVMSTANAVTFIEDCPLNNGATARVCTIVEEKATTTVTMTATVGSIASGSGTPVVSTTASGSGTPVVSTTISATPTNYAARVSVAGASLLRGVVVGAVFAGVMA